MSFDGQWRIAIPTPIGRQDVTLHIVDREGQLSGTATLGDETVPFIDPVIDGTRIRWSQTVTKPMRLTIRFDLVREGDRLSGTAKPGILPATTVAGARAGGGQRT